MKENSFSSTSLLWRGLDVDLYNTMELLKRKKFQGCELNICKIVYEKKLLIDLEIFGSLDDWNSFSNISFTGVLIDDMFFWHKILVNCLAV